MVVNGVGVANWVWGQACLPALGMSSSSLLRMDRDGALCSMGLHDMTWVVLSLLNVWILLIVFTFTSMSTVSNGSRHLKYPCRKLLLDLRIQTIWKISCIAIQSFSNVNHMVSCVATAKVNHVIPCLSIMWKSRGSFFIKHLILILSWSLIVTTLGKLILLSLKVTLTFSSLILEYLKCNFYLI